VSSARLSGCTVIEFPTPQGLRRLRHTCRKTNKKQTGWYARRRNPAFHFIKRKLDLLRARLNNDASRNCRRPMRGSPPQGKGRTTRSTTGGQAPLEAMSDQELLLADLMPNLEASQRARMCHHRQDAALCPRCILFYARFDKGERIEDKKTQEIPGCYSREVVGPC
jgi:hypothetical protein